ncbi:LytTR family DNA-binding domain-containing protein [Pedobacter foliorum]|uniref:LytR/AlgR family response regulator transcription factor n=1 Tax=Pedobacter foliorum TaxID=2739058 RepID=UPI001564C015|nr:LytTR family DNA-binding domain-containing protein [Pedobacter foliorum]NRF41116.1 response regulator transcription factor [Pedobacter foliorum]
MKNILNCVIIDDDPDAIEVLRDYIAEFPGLKLVQMYTNPAIALANVIADQADLFFLDIDMPGISGIQIAERLKEREGTIVFTTAHAEYAVKSYDLMVKYYLLKPIDFGKFASVVSDVISLNYIKPDSSDVSDDAIYVRTGERGKVTKVLKSDILYIQAAGNYVQLLLQDKNHTTYMTLSEMADELGDDSRFYRVHKSYIINEDYVERVIGNIIDLGKYQVPMSSQYKNSFRSYLEQKTLVSKRL